MSMWTDCKALRDTFLIRPIIGGGGLEPTCVHLGLLEANEREELEREFERGNSK